MAVYIDDVRQLVVSVTIPEVYGCINDVSKPRNFLLTSMRANNFITINLLVYYNE